MFCSLHVWLCNLFKTFRLEYHKDLYTLRFVNTVSFQSQTRLYIFVCFLMKCPCKNKHAGDSIMHNHYDITNHMFSNEGSGFQPHSFYWFLWSMILPYRDSSLFPMCVHLDDCVHCTPHQWNKFQACTLHKTGTFSQTNTKIKSTQQMSDAAYPRDSNVYSSIM